MTSGIYALLLNSVVELRRHLALDVLNFLFSSEIVDQIDNILSLKSFKVLCFLRFARIHPKIFASVVVPWSLNWKQY